MDSRIFGAMLHPDIEDRRDEELSPADYARLLLGEGPSPNSYDPADLKPVPINPLGVQAGMLDIVPGHQMWVARRKLAEQLAIQANPDIHSFAEATDPNGPPLHLDRRKK